jgi:phage terminase large subunit-like protein
MAAPTVTDFVKWAAKIVLDTGETWIVEDWQKAIIRDIFSGKPANWVVVPEGNGKTTLMAGLALFHLDIKGWRLEQPFVVVAAATREQAEWLYVQAENMVYSTPGMSKRFKCQSGFRRIKRMGPGGPGRIQIFAADDRTADGAIFTLGIIDELHNHRDLRLWRRWYGKLAKRGGQLIAISTAGEPGSEFEETRTTILRQADKIVEKGAHIRAEDENIILNDWAVRDRKKIGDMRVVAAANPRKAVTAEVLRQKSPAKNKTISTEHFMRFNGNIATRIEGSAVLAEDWDAGFESDVAPDPGVWTIGGIDLAFTMDTTGLVVLAWESFERRIIAWSKILEPPVEQNDIVKAMVEAQEEFEPVKWVYDPSLSGAQMAQMLERGEHPRQGDTEFAFTEYSQTTTPMALAAARFDEAVRNHYFVHNGDSELRKHVLNATKKEVGGGKWRFERPVFQAQLRGSTNRRRHPTDALIALAMAHSVAVDEMGQPNAEPMLAFV